MSGPFKSDDILPHNPGVDPQQLEEARQLHRRLREQGVRRKVYDLAPPFGGRRVSAREDAGADPRMVRLKRSSDTE